MPKSLLRQTVSWFAMMVATAACTAERGSAPPPILELAVADGEVPVGNEPHLLALSDERVVITAMGTHAVVVYDFERNTADTVGRDGGGPGEFALPSAIGSWPDGRFTVLDEMLRRVTVIRADLRIDTAFAYPNTEFALHVPTDAHNWIATGVARVRDSIPLVRLTAPGGHHDTIALLATPHTQFIPLGNIAFNLPIEYAARDVWGTLADGRLWIARGADNRVDWIGADGVPRHGVPFPFRSIRTTALDRKKVAGLPAPAIFDTVRREMSVEKAPFQHVVAAGNGSLWFWLNQPAGYTSELYEIRSPDGNVVSQLRAPSGHKLMAISSKFLYFVGENSDGEWVLSRHQLPPVLKKCCSAFH